MDRNGPTAEKNIGKVIIVWEPNSQNCLDLIFVASTCQKAIIRHHVQPTSAVRKFMLDMPNPGSFQNISPKGSEDLNPCGSNRKKMKKLNSKMSLHTPIVH